jgi:hypothetical protein
MHESTRSRACNFSCCIVSHYIFRVRYCSASMHVMPRFGFGGHVVIRTDLTGALYVAPTTKAGPSLMSVMEYYPQERRHPTARSASVGSSNSQVENDLSEYQESASDLSMDSRSIYVLSGPPPVPPAPPAVSHPSACTALSEESRLMPLQTDKSVNGGGYATPGASNTDVIISVVCTTGSACALCSD